MTQKTRRTQRVQRTQSNNPVESHVVATAIQLSRGREPPRSRRCVEEARIGEEPVTYSESLDVRQPCRDRIHLVVSIEQHRRGVPLAGGKRVAQGGRDGGGEPQRARLHELGPNV